MTINVSVSKFEESKKKIEYPYIGYLSNHVNELTKTVVLFVSKNTGTVIAHDNESFIGHYSKDWVETNFIPLPSSVTITLSNDKS